MRKGNRMEERVVVVDDDVIILKNAIWKRHPMDIGFLVTTMEINSLSVSQQEKEKILLSWRCENESH